MDVVDIAPELLGSIRQTWREAIAKSSYLQKLREGFDQGRGGFLQADHYAEEMGRLLSNAYRLHLTEPGALPNDRLYYNIAEKIIPPLLREDFIDIAGQTAKVIRKSNREENLNIDAVIPDIDEDRIQGLVDGSSSQETIDESLFYLGEPIINFSVHTVDLTAKRNAEFQRSIGLFSVIIRTTNGKCCPWCEQFAGTYAPGEAGEAYARHEYCNCLIEMKPQRMRPR